MELSPTVSNIVVTTRQTGILPIHITRNSQSRVIGILESANDTRLIGLVVSCGGFKTFQP